MIKNYDVVIAGGGVIGASCAYSHDVGQPQAPDPGRRSGGGRQHAAHPAPVVL
uniref:Truncated HcnC n=1 Tax=Pseudomonas fluorescens TaxID=294 RepID=Q1G407_PSEFL|nr:truncated HcnC [Pseudomonas fluorescens]